MGRSTNRTALLALAALVGLSWPASDAAARMVSRRGGEPLRRPGPSTLEFVLEGGLAEPLGGQTGSFLDGEGYDAGTGYELGLRLRQFLGGWFSVSPSFHYASFGTASGVGDFAEGDGLGYEVHLSALRYGLDLEAWLGDPRARVRPFLCGGVALVHNRYRDSLQYYQDYRTSENAPSWSAGAGFRFGSIELSAHYVFNRFDTRNLAHDGLEHHYDWDYGVVRAGFAFGGR